MSSSTEGLRYFDRLRKCKMMGEPFVCPPPVQFKDWNEAHIKDFDLKKWFATKSFAYDYEYKIINSL